MPTPVIYPSADLYMDADPGFQGRVHFTYEVIGLPANTSIRVQLDPLFADISVPSNPYGLPPTGPAPPPAPYFAPTQVRVATLTTYLDPQSGGIDPPNNAVTNFTVRVRATYQTSAPWPVGTVERVMDIPVRIDPTINCIYNGTLNCDRDFTITASELFIPPGSFRRTTLAFNVVAEPCNGGVWSGLPGSGNATPILPAPNGSSTTIGYQELYPLGWLDHGMNCPGMTCSQRATIGISTSDMGITAELDRSFVDFGLWQGCCSIRFLTGHGNLRINVASSVPAGQHTVTVTAISGTRTVTKVIPITVGYFCELSQLVQLQLLPADITGGMPTIGKVILSGPAGNGGQSVTLTTSDAHHVKIPHSVYVPQGQSEATFSIHTRRVLTNRTATISARYHSPTLQTATLALHAPPTSGGSGGASTPSISAGPLTLTTEAQQMGFQLKTFAENFPGQNPESYIGSATRGITVNKSNEALIVNISNSRIYRMPIEVDGQDAQTAPFVPSPSYALTSHRGKIYATQGLTIAELTDQGEFVRLITNQQDYGFVDLKFHPVTGALFASAVFFNQAAGTIHPCIVQIDLQTGSIIKFVDSLELIDAIVITEDGETIYGSSYDPTGVDASKARIRGWNLATRAKIFETTIPTTGAYIDPGDGLIAPGPDGIALGLGTLSGKLIANCHSGVVWMVDLNTGHRTLIASGGKAGDFVQPAPDGSLLLSRGRSVARLIPPPGASFWADSNVVYTREDTRKSGNATTGQIAPGTTPAAAFVRLDTLTQGNWIGAYGRDGYRIIGGTTTAPPAAYPPYASGVTITNAQHWAWAATTTEVRAPLLPGGSGRVAASLYNGSSFSVRIPCTDAAQGAVHQVALYLLDWDQNNTRRARIEAWDTVGNVKLGEQVVSAFRDGAYVIWNVRGDVTFKIVNLSGSANAVVSAILFDPADIGNEYAPFTFTTPLAAAGLTAAFDLNGAGGTILAAQARRGGTTTHTGVAPNLPPGITLPPPAYDLQWGFQSLQPGGPIAPPTTFGTVVENLQGTTLTFNYASNWEIEPSFFPDIAAGMGAFYRVRLIDRVSAFCPDFLFTDTPRGWRPGGAAGVTTFSSPSQDPGRNRLSLLVAPYGNPEIVAGRSQTITLGGPAGPINLGVNGWEIRYKDKIVASSGNPGEGTQQWKVERASGPYGGVVVTAPTEPLTTGKHFELRMTEGVSLQSYLGVPGFAVNPSASSGPWRYGYTANLTSAFTPFPNTISWNNNPNLVGYHVSAPNNIPFLLANISQPPVTITEGTLVAPPNALTLHPGNNGEYAVLRFVAPATGTYVFTGQFQGRQTGGPSTDVHIRFNGQDLFSGTVSSTPTTVPFNNITVPMAEGETVDFAVGNGGNGMSSDDTALVVMATRYLPGSATFDVLPASSTSPVAVAAPAIARSLTFTGDLRSGYVVHPLSGTTTTSIASTLHLDAPAPQGGATLVVTPRLPASLLPPLTTEQTAYAVTIPAGQTSGTFNLSLPNAPSLTEPVLVPCDVQYNGDFKAFLVLLPQAVGVAPSTAPTVTATPGDAQVQLTWNRITSALSYNIYRAPVTGGVTGSYTRIYRAALVPRFTDTQVTNGQIYSYQVAAENYWGEGPRSTAVSATPLGGTVQTPVIEPTGGTFAEYVAVNLSCPTPFSYIYYTLDGSDPGPGNPAARVFSTTIVLSPGTTTVKTRAYREGWQRSELASATFVVQPIPPIECDQPPVSAVLSGTDVPSLILPNFRAKHYTFTGDQGTRITIRLQSTQFDTMLALFKGVPGSGLLLTRWNDNDPSTPGSTDSVITYVLPYTGTYTIEVTSSPELGPWFTGGAFTLAVENCEPVDAVPPDAPIALTAKPEAVYIDNHLPEIRQIVLTWEQPMLPDGSNPPDGYTIERREVGGNWVMLIPQPNSMFFLGGAERMWIDRAEPGNMDPLVNNAYPLQPNKKYEYRIKPFRNNTDVPGGNPVWAADWSNLAPAHTFAIPPVVAFLSPYENAILVQGQPVTLRLSASATNGAQVQAVKVWANAQLLGTATLDPASPANDPRWKIDWTPPAFGSYFLEAEVQDSNGLYGDTPPMRVTVSPSQFSGPDILPNVTTVDGPTIITLYHPIHGVDLFYTTNGTMPVPGAANTKKYVGPFVATLPPGQTGTVTIRAIAFLPEYGSPSNEATKTYTITAASQGGGDNRGMLDLVGMTGLGVNPAGTGVPTIVANALTSDKVGIKGLVPYGETFAYWTIDYRRVEGVNTTFPDGQQGTGLWQPLASGTQKPQKPEGNLLAEFDTTNLPNGMYELRLHVVDTAGQPTDSFRTVVVRGGNKLGPFTLPITDLTIPAPGFPITISRIYDSSEKERKGDFGYGWRLTTSNATLEKSRTSPDNIPAAQESHVIGQGWRLSGSNITDLEGRPHLLTITVPGGGVYVFYVSYQGTSTIGYVRYNAIPGNTATLTPLQGNTLVFVGQDWNNGDPDGRALYDADPDDGGFPYDCNRFLLTLRDGTKFYVNSMTGLEMAEDRVGNRQFYLTVSPTEQRIEVVPAGAFLPARRVQILRNPSTGFITQIKNTADTGLNSTLVYAQDAAGNLTAFTDRKQVTTNYRYDYDHSLLEVRDPRVPTRALMKNHYDTDGRLVASEDAQGRRTTMGHKVGEHQEVITDPSGQQSLLQFDKYGNVQKSVQYLKTVDGNGQVQTQAVTTEARYGWGLHPAYAGTQISSRDALGREQAFRYDFSSPNPTMDLLATVSPRPNPNYVPGVNDPFLTTHYTYDARGQVKTVLAPDGTQTVQNEYLPGTDLLLSTQDALGNHTIYDYNPDGSVKAVRDAKNNKTEYLYDPVTRELLKVTTRDELGNPTGSETTFTYDAYGNKKTQTVTRINSQNQPETLVTTFDYDENGRLTKTTTPETTPGETFYNALGKVERRVDALGRETLYSYDEAGRLVTTTAPGNQISRTFYDANGRAYLSVSPSGAVSKTEHDTLDRAFQTTSYDAVIGNVGVTDPAQLTLQNAVTNRTLYDAAGQAIGSVDGRGNQTTSVYDEEGRVAQSWHNSRPNDKTVHHYDLQGRNDWTKDARGYYTLNVFDAAGRVIKTYAGLTAPTIPTGGSGTGVSATFVSLDTATQGNWVGVYGQDGYNIIGASAQNPSYATITPAHNQFWTWLYSTTAARALVKPGSTDRIAACWFNTSTFNIRVANTDTNLHRVALYLLDWEAGGRQLRVEAWNTATNTKLGEQVVTGFQNGTYVVWNVRGDVTFKIVNLVGNGVVSGLFFDPAEATAALPVSETVYDKLGRRIVSRDGAGRTMAYRYDALGRLIAVAHVMTTNALPTDIQAVTDESTQYLALFDTTNPNHPHLVTTYDYDEVGNKIRQTDALGRHTLFAYDKNGRMVKRTLPMGQFETIHYKEDGRLDYKTDFNNKTTQYEYLTAGPNLGKLWKIVPDVSLTGDAPIEYGYISSGVNFGRKQTTTYGDVVLSYAFDARGRMESIQTTLSSQILGKLVYGYDTVGNKTSVTTYNGIGGLTATGTNTFEVDEEDRLWKVKNGAQTLATYGYNANGSLQTVTRPNMTTTYAYTGRNELEWIRHSNAGTSLDAAQGFYYQMDASGKRTALHDGSQTTWNGTTLAPNDPTNGGARYTFDLAGRLTREDYPNGRYVAYTYDKVGNRKTRSEKANASASVLTTQYDYTDNDHLEWEYKPDGTKVYYSYDANGRLTNAQHYTAAMLYDKRIEYAYTFDGRMAEQRVFEPNYPMVWSSRTLYNYDGEGNRIGVRRETFNHANSTLGAWTAHHYLIDPSQPYAEVVQEWEQTGVGNTSYPLTLTARYDIGLDRLRMLRVTQPPTGPPVVVASWYAFDGLGSTRALVDDAGNGSDLWGYADAFGLPTRLAGSTANAFLFNGQQWDQNEELYFLRARYYQASQGRFIGQDPVEGTSFQSVTLHRYLYAGGDPANNIDPSGNSFLGVTISGIVQAHLIAMVGGAITNTIIDFTFAKIFHQDYGLADAGQSLFVGAITEGGVIAFGKGLQLAFKIASRNKKFFVYGVDKYLKEVVDNGGRRWATTLASLDSSIPLIDSLKKFTIGGDFRITKFGLRPDEFKNLFIDIQGEIKSLTTRVEVPMEEISKYMPSFSPNLWSWWKGFMGQYSFQAPGAKRNYLAFWEGFGTMSGLSTIKDLYQGATQNYIIPPNPYNE
jgi:RHS repeat-associated protein